MWQSQVEIEHYSVMYFDHVIALSCSKRRSTELPLRVELIRTV